MQDRKFLEETDWIFDVLIQLADSAEEVGFHRLASHLDSGMDILEADEKLIYDALHVFCSARFNSGRSSSNEAPRSESYSKAEPPSGVVLHPVYKTVEEYWAEVIELSRFNQHSTPAVSGVR